MGRVQNYEDESHGLDLYVDYTINKALYLCNSLWCGEIAILATKFFTGPWRLATVFPSELVNRF